MDPGAYVRLTDSAYETNWTPLAMASDGAGGWSATLPEELQSNRRLVRYRIHFSDSLGNSQTVPYADAGSPNFAYFVYDGVPQWSGAFRPGETEMRTISPETLTSVPVYTLVADGTDVINCQYNSSYNKVRMLGTFVADGVVHDHIQFRNRGEGSIYQAGKNKWRFYFHRGSRFQARDAEGVPYAETWKNFSGNPGAAAWAPLNRGAAGLDEMLSFRSYQLAGVPSPNTHHYHFRVVRGAEENPTSGTSKNDPLGNADGQYLGDFWGLYLAIEPLTGSFLKEHALPDGNIYKIEGNSGDKKEQAPGMAADSSDWSSFRNAHVNADPTEQWWRGNLDLEAYFSFHAINRLVGNVDLRGGANHYFYHRSTDGRWVPIPWDLDMMFIAKHHWGSPFGSSVPDVIHAHKAILQHPAIALEFRNRAREILDLFASDPGATGGQFGQLVAEIGGRVHQAGSLTSLAWADACLWNLHPRTRGSDGNASGQENHRGNFFRSPFRDSREGGSWTRWLREPAFSGTAAPEDLFDYFIHYTTDTWPGGDWQPNNGDQRGYGYQFLAYDAADPNIPATPELAYSGGAGFPANQLHVTASDFSGPGGAGSFAARQWRVARVGDGSHYEINALWTSVTTDPAQTEMDLPSAPLETGATYRARVRQCDAAGRWSHWSAPVEFTVAPARNQLIHYWNFNDKEAPAAVTQSAGGAALAAEGETLSDNGKDFAGRNARFGDKEGRHLRINNPLTAGTELRFSLPTGGFGAVLVQYETRRSGQGAGDQIIEYTTDGSSYHPFATVAVLDGVPEIVELDFRQTAGADDNPDFGIRITFALGAGGTAGNHRIDNLTVEGLSLAGGPRLIPVTDAAWGFPENWHSGAVPDGVGDLAIVGAPQDAERAVELREPVTLGTLEMENAAEPLRNRLTGEGALTFDGGAAEAELTLAGTGEGYAELDLDGGVVLTGDLTLDVPTSGSPDFGALRLRGPWSGPGGIIKEGPGTASLTGEGKLFTGPVTVREGVLRITSSSAPLDAAEVSVADGGQLRLTSAGPAEEPAVHAPGGVLTLAGPGASLADGGRGALRYQPETGEAVAELPNPLVLAAAADVHVAGAGSRLILGGALQGAGPLLKSGAGTLVLGADSGAEAPALAVEEGVLAVEGAHPASVVVAAAGVLTGGGSLGAISGAGTVDVLALGAADAPLPQAPERVELFLEGPLPLPQAGVPGGLLVPAGVDLASLLSASQIGIFLPDPEGAVRYRGASYRPAGAEDRLAWSVAATAEGSVLRVAPLPDLSGYDLWRATWFEDPEVRDNEEIAGPAASAAGDGVANLLRYAHGVGPYDPVRHLLPEMALVDGAAVFLFRYDPALDGLRWRILSSPDLIDWETVEFDSTTDPAPVETGAGWFGVPAHPDSPRRFYRLELTLL